MTPWLPQLQELGSVVRTLRIPVPKAKDPRTNFSLSFNLTVKAQAYCFLYLLVPFANFEGIAQNLACEWKGHEATIAARVCQKDENVGCQYTTVTQKNVQVVPLLRQPFFSLMLSCFHEFHEHVQLTTTQCFIL